ncbi:hypothetical protein FRC10_009427 [Ceratobasidium sp. 414]|nr:hypothetical protein FRC10_009427 [Ceratobasidium sp. 414]
MWTTFFSEPECPSGTLSGNRSNPVLNKHGKDDGMHVMVYRAVDIEKDSACRLTRGGMILIGLLSGGDYDSGAKRCGPKTALALAQLGLGDELLDAFQTLSAERFADYVPAWKDAVVEALRSGCATMEDGFEGEDEDEETQETAVTASQGEPISASQRSTTSISASQQKSKKSSGKAKAKKPPARRQPALAAEIAASDFPDLSVLREYCAPWTSERAFATGGTTSGPLDDELLPASQGSVITSSQRSTASNSRSKKKAPTGLTVNSVGVGGLTSDVRIGWTGELALGALGRICEQYFEWGVREIIQHRFRTLLWPAVVLRVLRRSIMEQERVRTRENRSSTPRPSTPTRKSAEPIVPGTPRRLLNKHFGSGGSASDSGSDSEHGPGYVRGERRGGDETPKARRTISAEGNQVDPHQLLQGVKGEREHASTDGLREFRVEVAPKHLARLAVRELLGTRDPALLAGTMFDMEGTPRGDGEEEDDGDGDGEEESIPRRLKMADSAAAVRVWVPAELVQSVHPELVRAWEERGTKSKSKAKLTSGSTARRKAAKNTEGGTAKKGGPSAKTKTNLKEKARPLPTTLSGDEVEAAPASRSVTSRGSPPCEPPPKAVTKPQPASRSSNGLKSKEKEGASTHAVTLSGSDTEVESRPLLPGSSEPLPKPKPKPKLIPATRLDSGSITTELPSYTRAKPPTHVAGSALERSPSPAPTIPPIPSGSKARPAASSAASGAPRKKAGIPGVVHVPSPPRRAVTRAGPASDSSELEDVSFRMLLARPEKRPASESDSDSEISAGGKPKSPRLGRVETSPRVPKTSGPTATRRPVVAKSTSPTRRPAPRSHSSSRQPEVEILDPPALVRPSKHKAHEPDTVESRAEDSTSKIARKSRKQASPRASSASEGENQTKAVGVRKTVAKPRAPSMSRLRAKAGPSSARASTAEAVIDIASSSDDSFTMLPPLAPKVTVHLGPAIDRITRPGELTRLDSRWTRTRKTPGPMLWIRFRLMRTDMRKIAAPFGP